MSEGEIRARRLVWDDYKATDPERPSLVSSSVNKWMSFTIEHSPLREKPFRLSGGWKHGRRTKHDYPALDIAKHEAQRFFDYAVREMLDTQGHPQ